MFWLGLSWHVVHLEIESYKLKLYIDTYMLDLYL